MTEDNYRLKRIERILEELEYEVVRGMVDNEIDETITFRFRVPISRQIQNGVVECQFTTRPALPYFNDPTKDRLRLVSRAARGEGKE
jgi:hypothetical protein